MKSRVMLAADTLEAASFLNMSVNAQLLYVRLALHADSAGRVLSPSRIAEGYYRFPPEALDELLRSGYLLAVSDGGETDYYLSRCFIDNKKCASAVGKLENSRAWKAGLLEFSGAPFQSAYRIASNPTPRDTSQQIATNRDKSECVSPNTTTKEKTKEYATPMENKTETANAKLPPTIRETTCPRCGKSARATTVDGRSYLRCDAGHVMEIDKSGEPVF